MQELIGQTLGQYRIMEQIGEGGMAAVYKAYQPGLDRYVAVKVLPPIFAQEQGFSERFLREAKAIANLHHRNILPVYDSGQDNGYSFIVMRHIEGALTGIEGFTLGRFTKAETYTVPLLGIRPEAGAGITIEAIVEALREGEPRIIVDLISKERSVVINPHMLQPGQERIVARRCKEVLTQGA